MRREVAGAKAGGRPALDGEARPGGAGGGRRWGGVRCCHLLSSHCVLGTGGYSPYLTQSSCIGRVLWAKEGSGERDINRK